MTHYDELVSVCRMHSSLIEESEVVDDEYILAIANQSENIRLKRQRINIRLSDDIEITNVDNHFVFSLFFNCLSDAEDRIRKER